MRHLVPQPLRPYASLNTDANPGYNKVGQSGKNSKNSLGSCADMWHAGKQRLHMSPCTLKRSQFSSKGGQKAATNCQDVQTQVHENMINSLWRSPSIEAAARMRSSPNIEYPGASSPKLKAPYVHHTGSQDLRICLPDPEALTLSRTGSAAESSGKFDVLLPETGWASSNFFKDCASGGLLLPYTQASSCSRGINVNCLQLRKDSKFDKTSDPQRYAQEILGTTDTARKKKRLLSASALSVLLSKGYFSTSAGQTYAPVSKDNEPSPGDTYPDAQQKRLQSLANADTIAVDGVLGFRNEIYVPYMQATHNISLNTSGTLPGKAISADKTKDNLFFPSMPVSSIPTPSQALPHENYSRRLQSMKSQLRGYAGSVAIPQLHKQKAAKTSSPRQRHQVPEPKLNDRVQINEYSWGFPLNASMNWENAVAEAGMVESNQTAVFVPNLIPIGVRVPYLYILEGSQPAAMATTGERQNQIGAENTVVASSSSDILGLRISTDLHSPQQEDIDAGSTQAQEEIKMWEASSLHVNVPSGPDAWF